MENVKLSVVALATIKGMTIKQLAKECGISESHLRKVSAGYAKMTARDLIALATACNVSPFSIKID